MPIIVRARPPTGSGAVAHEDAPPQAAPGVPACPSRDELRTMGRDEARRLSDALFERLADLAPETHDYSAMSAAPSSSSTCRWCATSLPASATAPRT